MAPGHVLPGNGDGSGLAAAILAIVFAAAVSYTFERLFLVTLP